jgi:hypothetical protein
VSSIAIGLIVFVLVFGSALLATLLHSALPEHHLSADSKDVVKLGVALIIFASFGLFAPRNTTVLAVLGVCALSVAGAVFLIIELDRSFEGLLQVSGAPLRSALAQLGR